MAVVDSIRPASPFARLQRLARPQAALERCELCGATIAAEHSHLLELDTRQLHCTCDACGLLFSGESDQRYRRVTRRVSVMRDLEFSDNLWEELRIPINLAFFYHSSRQNRVIGIYPSVAGAIESQLPLEAWEKLAASSQALRKMQSDVEALLVNRMGSRRDCFIVSIDRCYRLIGLIRANWRGLTGGKEVRNAIEEFFNGLHSAARKTPA